MSVSEETADPRAARKENSWYDPKAAGLYVHIPFCASICGYCDFFRLESPDGVPPGFEDLLLTEAGRYGEEPPVRVDTIFFGGGTPSLLGPARLERLLDGLRKTFAVAPGAEVTLEANPETVSREAASAWRAAGVNRLSIGVQSLEPRVLLALDRRATAEQALGAVELAAEAGFAHLSADVMSAVPGQDGPSLLATLRALAALPLDHLSIYSLDLHPNTPLSDAVDRGEKRLPDDEAAADMFLAVHDLLLDAGFEHYEVSNFAREGGRCRHNLRCWMGGDTIALGPSAWSRFRGELFGNPRSLRQWSSALERGEAAQISRETLSPARLQEDRLIFGLRVSDGVALEEVAAILEDGGRDPEARLRPLAESGYVELGEGRIRLTTKGFLMSNDVLTYLLPGRWPRGR